MAGNGFRWKDETLFNNLKTFEPKLDRALIALTEYYGGIIEDKAKTNAPWRDQTGNARNGLSVVVEHSLKKHRIILFHRMPYGIWLEVRFDGRNQIIKPTLLEQGTAMLGQANTLLGRIT